MLCFPPGFTKETCRIMIAMLDVSRMPHTLRDMVVGVVGGHANG